MIAAAVPGTTLTLCRLRVERVELKEQIFLRGRGGGPAIPGDELKGLSVDRLSRLAEEAAQSADELERDKIGDLYVDTDGHSLEEVAKLVRAQAGGRPSTAEAAAAFRALVGARRLLMVLENAYDAAQVRPLLPAGPSGVLITSRQGLATLDNTTHVHVDVLAAEDSLLLLTRLAGPQRMAAEPAAAADVIRCCANLPLALRIAGARLAARPTWPVRALA